MSKGCTFKLPEDLAGDGTHPSPSGRRKVAGLLLRFLKTDPTARAWFAAGQVGEPSHVEPGRDRLAPARGKQRESGDER